MNRQPTCREKGRTANKVLPKWRQKCFYETVVQGSTVVLLINSSAKMSHHRQYANRAAECYLMGETMLEAEAVSMIEVA